MQRTISPAKGVRGRIELPGDKSIAHRALLLGALAEGDSELSNLPASHDVRSTLRCLRSLGVTIEEDETRATARVRGGGLSALSAPEFVLDAGNSGTTARLLLGILAAQPFDSLIDGDGSLRSRPMGRVIRPLSRMGARFEPLVAPDCLPLRVSAAPLAYLDAQTEVASAQVKSSILLAGLCSGQGCSVSEPLPTRDHTEIMLEQMGADLQRSNGAIKLAAGSRLTGRSRSIPGDASSAAFFIAAALLVPDSEIELPATLVNPHRRGLLNLLQRMGAQLELDDADERDGEQVATIVARTSQLSAVSIAPDEIPGMIDELPLLAVLATQASGRTRVSGAAELRVKESDRIRAIAEGIRALGGAIEELPDGFVVDGPQQLCGGSAGSCGDHRIAMALAVGALCCEQETTLAGAECVAISYPGFWDDMDKVVQL